MVILLLYSLSGFLENLRDSPVFFLKIKLVQLSQPMIFVGFKTGKQRLVDTLALNPGLYVCAFN